MATTYRVQNPATNEIVATFEQTTDQELQETLQRADAAYKTWSALSYEERAAYLRKVAQLFDERRDTLVNIIAEEMGKAINQGDGEVSECVEICNYYADHGAEFGADEPLPHDGGDIVIRKVPLGVIVGVMPWNFPYYQVARFAAPTLMAGNTIILKHASICPRSAEAIQQIFDDAGVPEGVFNYRRISHSQIEDLLADPRVQGVSLTGSEGAGKAVAKAAGANLKKALLELGGTDAYIVLDTDDIDREVRTAMKKRMSNVGQACTSNKRIIVMDDIYDEFVSKMVDAVSALRQGDPFSPERGCYYPLSSRDAAETLRDQVAAAVEAGATLHCGGELTGEGAYFTPAVITDIPVGSDSYYEEFFGPVVEIYKVSTDEEAVELANNSRYGLGGAVFSTDEERAKKVANQVVTGMIHVNIPQARGAGLPFGGVKNSGFGRELGPLGMDEFVNKQRYFVAK